MKVLKAFSFIVMFLLISLSSVVQAQQVEIPSDTNRVIEVLDKIQQAPEYQVNVDITNLKYNVQVSQLEVIGNRDTGDAQIILTMQPLEREASPIQVQMMLYDNVRYYYVKLASLIAQSGLLKRDTLTKEQKDFIQTYQDYYVELTPEQVQTKGIVSFADAIWLMPREEKLRIFLDKGMNVVGDTVIASHQLTDIPEFFYDQTKQLTMMANIMLEHDSQSHTIKVQPKFDLQMDDYGIDLNARLTVKPKSAGINFQSIRAFALGEVDFSKDIVMEMQSLLQKLKRVDFVVNEAEKRFRWTNIGVIEEMNLNLWSENPAYTRAADYRMNYVYQVKENTLPMLTELPRLSLQEFHYFLNELSMR